jgi:hypothetical protein
VIRVGDCNAPALNHKRLGGDRSCPPGWVAWALLTCFELGQLFGLLAQECTLAGLQSLQFAYRLVPGSCYGLPNLDTMGAVSSVPNS